jgi:hypothetical protein
MGRRMGRSPIMATKYFHCDNCESTGKVTVKTNDVTIEDIVFCPVCGADIFEEDEDDHE